MILCLLSCVHQTCDMINVYPVNIISYHYPVLYHILSLSYHVHQTDPQSDHERDFIGLGYTKIFEVRFVIFFGLIVILIFLLSLFYGFNHYIIK